MESVQGKRVEARVDMTGTVVDIDSPPSQGSRKKVRISTMESTTYDTVGSSSLRREDEEGTELSVQEGAIDSSEAPADNFRYSYGEMDVVPVSLRNIQQKQNQRSPRRSSTIRQTLLSTTKEEFKASSKSKIFIREVWLLFILPTLISVWYCAAILFPPGSNDGWRRYLLWTDGELTKNDEGRVMICPRASICSEGVAQVILIALARISAFALYVCMAWTFASKMHSWHHFLSSTYAETILPFESMHKVHHRQGILFAALALLHTIVHIIRWGLRNELGTIGLESAGISGYFAMFFMVVVIWSMTLAKKVKWMKFEYRFDLHWLFSGVVLALCFHTERTRIITLFFAGLWFADYIYGYLFRTHRLDITEFTTLADGKGAQMLWRNPSGFNPKSGEFVRVQIPWLTEGGSEWHPFSLYMEEATKEGIQEMRRKSSGSIFLGGDAKGGQRVSPSKSALILLECQNEWASSGGALYDDVRGVVQSNKVLENLTSLTKRARKMGAQVFHAPIIFKADMSNNYNPQLGVLKDYRLKGMFLEYSWNADFVAGLKPEQGDCTVTNKVGLDAFFRTNLEELLVEKGIETVILGGFLTNGSVESTMRSAYEKGLNVITLTDGTACRSALEQKIATENSFMYFSTPMTCSQVELIFQGQAPSGLRMITKLPSSRAIDISDEPESLEEFLVESMDRPLVEEDLLTLKEAREDVNIDYKTTQVFIQAAGDWSNGLNRDLNEGKQKRACWVRGPYISPYFVAKEFSHLLLTATGIGITPALGVLGQYPGNARTKILVWFVRSRDMLKFFAPLLKSAHMVLIYYTGKEKLTSRELKGLRDHGNGNMYIQQSRPNIVAVLTSVIVHFENEIGFLGKLDAMSSLHQIDLSARAAWCVLYCGGSIKVKDMIKEFTKDAGVGWQCELFDW